MYYFLIFFNFFPPLYLPGVFGVSELFIGEGDGEKFNSEETEETFEGLLPGVIGVIERETDLCKEDICEGDIERETDLYKEDICEGDLERESDLCEEDLECE